MKTKDRISYLDALKGFLILLVVYGHSVQAYSADFFNTATFKTIYSFHMAAFFLVSGYVLSLGRQEVCRLPSKIARLMVPYFMWFLLSVCLVRKWTVGESVGHVLSDGGLWFLLTLSECIAMAVICNALFGGKNRVAWLVLSGVALSVCAYSLGRSWLNVGEFAKYYRYFLFGYLLDAIKIPASLVDKYGKKTLVMLMMVIFLAGLVAISFADTGSLPFRVIKAGLAWTGSVGLFLLFSLLTFNHGAKWLIALGRNTLGVYAVHSFLLEIFAKTRAAIPSEFMGGGNFAICHPVAAKFCNYDFDR